MSEHGLSEDEFNQLCDKARYAETSKVLAAVDKDRRLATRATDFGMTLLMFASQGYPDNSSLIEGLLARGANVHARDNSDWNALMFASRYGHIAICTMFLKHKSDPDSRNQFTSALILASTNDYFDICLLLIIYRANLIMDVNGRTALDVYSSGACGRYEPDNKLSTEQRRLKLQTAFEQGPYPEMCWSRRWPFMSVMVCSGFRPLLIRLKELESQRDALIAKGEKIPGIPIDTLEKRKAYKIFQVFSCDGLLRLIVSFL